MNIRQRLLVIITLPIALGLSQWGLSFWTEFQTERHKAEHAAESQIAGYAVQLALLARDVGVDADNPRARQQWLAVNRRIDRALQETKVVDHAYMQDTVERLRMLRASHQRLLDDAGSDANSLTRQRRERHINTLGLHANALAQESLRAGRRSHSNYEQAQEFTDRLNRAISGIGALIVVVIAWLLGRDILQSVRELGQSAVRLADGNLNTRVDLHGRHELAELGRAFNRMAGQLGEKIESLRESETRFRNYFELGLIGMATISPEKGWIEANHTLLEMLGYSLEELQATTWPELTHPDDLEPDVTEFKRVLAGEIDGYNREKRFIRKDGEIVHAMLATKCMRKADGKVDYILALIDDVTDRKAWEYALKIMNRDLHSRVVEGREELSATSDRLNAALARLEAAQAAAIQTEKLSTIGRMVAAVAHELRNPLMGIINYVQYARECEDPERRAEVLGKASRGLSTLSKTVHNMLRFSRPQDGNAQPFNPEGPVRDALILISAELRGRGIQTELQLETLGQVVGEEHALQQVFLNLLINARDAVIDVPYPRISIRGGLHGGWLRLDLIDNGPGVDRSDEAKIFEPFFSTKPKDQGTGLGLAICRDILKDMGGSLNYLRSDDEETVFRIELPLAAGDQKADTQVLSG